MSCELFVRRLHDMERIPMFRTGLVYHDDYLEHRPGPAHPESPQRLTAIIDQLRSNGTLDKIIAVQPKHIDIKWLQKIHTPAYIAHVREICESGERYLDSFDTEVCARSYEIALLAAGGVIEGAAAVARGDLDNAFCAVRPPGHHAIANRALGFCLFNNIAIAARYLQKVHAIERILIVDWDVHHGNGTQAAFYEDDSVFYFSVHQYPHYPGTGAAAETGAGRGLGYTLNIPMFPGCGDREYSAAFEGKLLPAAAKFQPEFILVSAGFDIHDSDPLSSIRISDDGFRKISEIVVGMADELCHGRIVTVLEGGYALSALARCAEYHIQHLLHRAEL